MLWLFVLPTGVCLLNFFCCGSSVLFTVESLSLLYCNMYGVYLFIFCLLSFLLTQILEKLMVNKLL